MKCPFCQSDNLLEFEDQDIGLDLKAYAHCCEESVRVRTAFLTSG